jgi:heme-degrading monooxygenase HmoA
MSFANTPPAPYYACIFTSRRKPGDNGYNDANVLMLERVRNMPGFLGVESARNAEGFGITVSYWANLEAMQRWKADAEHRLMQQQGPRWYENYQVRIAKVEREYGLNPPASE